MRLKPEARGCASVQSISYTNLGILERLRHTIREPVDPQEDGADRVRDLGGLGREVPGDVVVVPDLPDGAGVRVEDRWRPDVAAVEVLDGHGEREGEGEERKERGEDGDETQGGEHRGRVRERRER